MKVFATIASVGLLISVTIGPASARQKAPESTEYVHQVDTYDYLASPNYQGLTPISTVSRNASIGLGTFNNLNGELVMVGGVVYRVDTSGVPRKTSTQRLTPFMQAVDFEADASLRIAPSTACGALPAIIDRLAKSTEGIVAVKLSGVFFDLKTRSVPRQNKPYPALADVVGAQVEFSLGRVNATLVGFRQGPDAQGVGAPGLHLHGLTKSKAAGGHVLSCVTGPRVLLEVQQTRGAVIHMPHN